jgi:ArsR family transcriptional regulator, arsenate/arsenite/antimonite-responsive transcriptional repressor
MIAKQTVSSVVGPGPVGDGACCTPLTEVPLSESASEEMASLFAALGDPVRLRLFSLVATGGEVCSCNLEEPLGRSQPTVSHHTRVLADAGLIVGERRGRWTWWRVAPGRLHQVHQFLGGT